MTERVDFDKYSDSYDALLHAQTAFFSKSDAYFARYKAELARKIVSGPIDNSGARLLEFGCAAPFFPTMRDSSTSVFHSWHIGQRPIHF